MIKKYLIIYKDISILNIKLKGEKMAIGTFREWLREGEINEATKQQLPDDIMDIFEKI